MDYLTYRSRRDEILRHRRPLRLECMNPGRALEAWVPQAEGEPSAGDVAAVLAAWSRVTGRAVDERRTLLGTGVRQLLAAILPLACEGADELWLPTDVYPVYWELARGAVRTRGYDTLPEPDWSVLTEASARAVLLSPCPLSPLGRMFDAEELRELEHWLTASADRWLLLDAAYTYDFRRQAALLEPLLASDRCAVLWSCSKPWLMPGKLGLAAVPPSIALHARQQTPSRAELSWARHAWTSAPALPMRQQRAFTDEWSRLAAAILAASPGWRPPSSGYFSVVPVPFERLLDVHGILAVPATVFGSAREELSILTCLHGLRQHADRG